MKLTTKQNKLLEFVKTAHGDQKRKYTGEPYWNHVYNVAETVSEYAPEGIEIALCHDLFEDTDASQGDLFTFLIDVGYESNLAIFIVTGVVKLTDIYTKEDYHVLNRLARKLLEANRLSSIPPLCQTIKYADLIDNTKYIVQHDKSFAKVYLNEKRQILKLMRAGNANLLSQCEALVNKNNN